MTGCYPTRVSVPGVLFPKHHVGLHPDEVTIADLLSAQGYATACIGKWHLGHKPSLLPTKQGFDRYFGIPYSNDMTIDAEAKLADAILFRAGMSRERMVGLEELPKNWVPLMRDDEVVEYPADQTTLTRRYTEEALSFIAEHKGEPFLLYLPHTMPHIPLFASEGFRGKSARGLYGDTIEEIDWSVGQVLGAIKAHGIDEETLVIYTSDNGPWKLDRGRGGSAYPLRGHKFSTYEGGMRVPCLMRWPGKIPAGTVTDTLAATIDLLPTFAKLAGATVPQDRVIDGKDIWPLLSGDPAATASHDYYYYFKGLRLVSIRHGEWKLRREEKSGTMESAVELYHLGQDIGETTNLADQHPDLVATLVAQMDAFGAEIKATVRPEGRH